MGEILQFRPRAEVPPAEAHQPTPAEVSTVLIAAIVTSMPDKARLAFYGRFQKMYDRAADNPERRELVRLAAEWVDAPLKLEA